MLCWCVRIIDRSSTSVGMSRPLVCRAVYPMEPGQTVPARDLQDSCSTDAWRKYLSDWTPVLQVEHTLMASWFLVMMKEVIEIACQYLIIGPD